MTSYEAAIKKYNDATAKAREGDKGAHKDNASAFEEVRGIERDAARRGEVLSRETGKVVKEFAPKRELQGEYVRRFSETKAVDPKDPKSKTERQSVKDRVEGKK